MLCGPEQSASVLCGPENESVIVVKFIVPWIFCGVDFIATLSDDVNEQSASVLLLLSNLLRRGFILAWILLLL